MTEQSTMVPRKLRGYASIIAEAIGDKGDAVLDEVEDLMRHVIFHSTLDWQTREQLHTAAREAYQLCVLMGKPCVTTR